MLCSTVTQLLFVSLVVNEDKCSLRLLSDDNSGWWMISNFSLRQRLHLLLALL